MSLRKRILFKMKPKMINDNQLNGNMFVSLIKSYTKAINEGKN